MSRRFNLDPRAPPTARAPPPAPAPPRAAAAPRPGAPLTATPPPLAPSAVPPSAGAAAASPPRSRRKTMWLVAGIVAVLLVGGAIALYAATELSYPNKYVLDDGEMPSGMSNARLSQSELDDAGLSRNPGRMDEAEFRDEFPSSSDPEEVHAQVLADARGARLVILAMQFADESDATSAGTEARALCSFANGAALRDGDVLVLVVPEGASSTAVGSVVRALKEKTPDLTQVCGPR